MSIRIAINGFGRIGRAFFHLASERDDVEVVAVNDLGDIDNLAYLLRHDSVYGPARSIIETKKIDDWRTVLLVDEREIPIFKEKDPTALPWRDLNVDVVVESTGHFTDYAKAKTHLDAGAKRVVISAPAKGSVEGMATGTVLMGINEDLFGTCIMTSNGSCTTNATSPVVQVLHEVIGIEKAMLNTVHAYTATQQLVDGADAGDWRRGRAAALNIVPSTTGAAQSVTEAVTDLAGKFDGISLRIPVPVGSIADITFVAKRDTTAEEVNDTLRKASQEERWLGILAVVDEPIVSSDIVGSRFAAIVDAPLTRVVGGNLVKVLSWYDNEMGYTQTLLTHVLKAAGKIQKQ